VDDPDLPKAFPDSLIQVFLDNGPDLFGPERMQVDRVFDRNFVHA